MLRLPKQLVRLPAGLVGRRAFSTAALRAEYSAEERAREEALRQKVQQKYRGMQIPPLSSYEYGHFSTMGLNATAAKAATDARAQGGAGFGGAAFPSRQGTDWLMLLTGCALVYFSGKILFRQFTRGVNGLEMPLWTASVEQQAKHLLFAVQFEQSEQDQLKREFEAVRQTNPFVDFFEWVRSRRPEFCCGRKYAPDYVVHALVSALRSSDGTQLASLARTLQSSLSRKNGDAMQRVDDFVDQLHSAGSLFQGLRGFGASNAYFPDQPLRPAYAPSLQSSQAGSALESDISGALDVKSGEAHSSTPFSEAK